MGDQYWNRREEGKSYSQAPASSWRWVALVPYCWPRIARMHPVSMIFAFLAFCSSQFNMSVRDYERGRGGDFSPISVNSSSITSRFCACMYNEGVKVNKWKAEEKFKWTNHVALTNPVFSRHVPNPLIVRFFSAERSVGTMGGAEPCDWRIQPLFPTAEDFVWIWIAKKLYETKKVLQKGSWSVKNLTNDRNLTALAYAQSSTSFNRY